MTNNSDGLLDDLRHKVQPGFSLGRNLLEVLTIICLGHLVWPQALGGFKRVGQRFNTTCINTVQLLHKGQDIRQTTGVSRNITGIDSQSRQVGNFLNICGIKRHGHSVSVIPAKKQGRNGSTIAWQVHLHIPASDEQAATLFS
jgi:hypothetical protein